MEWGSPGHRFPRERLGVLGAEDTSIPVTAVAYCTHPLQGLAGMPFLMLWHTQALGGEVLQLLPGQPGPAPGSWEAKVRG